MRIEKLTWDSDFFGFNVGRIFIYEKDDFDPREFKKMAFDNNYDLVYVFKFGNFLKDKEISEANLELVDIMLTLSKKLNKDDFRNITYDYRNQLSEQELKECYYIAEETSVVSRFFNESFIKSRKTRELYRKWIDNALNGSFSDGLFIEKIENKIVGIHLIKKDEINKTGFFTLTGVNPKFKRMGLGKKLWMQSFGYFSANDKIELIKSPFSFQNRESFNFHLKMGFSKIQEVKYIYHFRNNRQNVTI